MFHINLLYSVVRSVNYLLFCTVPWAPGGSKFTRNPTPPTGVILFDNLLLMYFNHKTVLQVGY